MDYFYFRNFYKIVDKNIQNYIKKCCYCVSSFVTSIILSCLEHPWWGNFERKGEKVNCITRQPQSMHKILILGHPAIHLNWILGHPANHLNWILGHPAIQLNWILGHPAIHLNWIDRVIVESWMEAGVVGVSAHPGPALVLELWTMYALYSIWEVRGRDLTRHNPELVGVEKVRGSVGGSRVTGHTLEKFFLLYCLYGTECRKMFSDAARCCKN